MSGLRMQRRAFQGLILFKNYRRTWSFPREIERLIMEETGDGTVLHLYGGLARFGVRLDMDVQTSPDVLGNALYPPFKCKSFDYVVVDPPYTDLRGGLGPIIITPAACLARKKVFWLHTYQCWSSTTSSATRRLVSAIQKKAGENIARCWRNTTGRAQ